MTRDEQAGHWKAFTNSSMKEKIASSCCETVAPPETVLTFNDQTVHALVSKSSTATRRVFARPAITLVDAFRLPVSI